MPLPSLIITHLVYLCKYTTTKTPPPIKAPETTTRTTSRASNSEKVHPRGRSSCEFDSSSQSRVKMKRPFEDRDASRLPFLGEVSLSVQRLESFKWAIGMMRFCFSVIFAIFFPPDGLNAIGRDVTYIMTDVQYIGLDLLCYTHLTARLRHAQH